MSNEENTANLSSRILIADDNTKNIQKIGAILRQEGYQIVVARNGNQALKAAEKAKPDLILLDVMMPEPDGFETCKQLKRLKFGKDIPVIFLGAKTEPEDIAKGFELGAVGYITKPFNAIELLSQARPHTELRRRQKLQGAIEMAGAVCHEMNQPLQSIMSYSDLLMMELDADSPAYGKVVKTAEQAEKMAKITEELMGCFELTRDKEPQDVIEIAGAVCHEMDQPFQCILGYSDLLLMELDADSPAYGKMVKIAEQIEKLAKITKKLYSRPIAAD